MLHPFPVGGHTPHRGTKDAIGEEIEVDRTSTARETTSIMFGKNGYSRLPTEDPGKAERVEGEACGKRGPRDLRPGVFYMFGQRARYAAAHSESEEMELSEVKLPAHRRPKHRRHKSPKSPKTPTSAGKGFRPRFTLIEEPILPGDTVQRVALRYSCPVSAASGAHHLVMFLSL